MTAANQTAKPPGLETEHNIAALFLAQTRANPNGEAIVERKDAKRRSLSFGELEERTARLASGLARQGLKAGERVALFVPPGIEFVAITWALLRMGAIPVLADPGMGRTRLLAALERTAPTAMIGAGRALLARRLFPRSFRSVRQVFGVGHMLPGLGRSMAMVENSGQGQHSLQPVLADDTAAILFTSGSTGPPKGVPISHSQLAAEVRGLRATLGFEPGERDLCGLPAFALFDCALGITSVFPRVDPARPDNADPVALLRVMVEERTSTGFLSPALWRILVAHCIANNKALPHLLRAVSAGAPLDIDVVRQLRSLLPEEGEIFTPYGATEALPVTVISGTELVDLTERIKAGEGTPVGRAAPEVEIRILDPAATDLTLMDPAHCLPHGAVGEILVRGPVVTQSYDAAPKDQAAAKLADPDGKAHWHRMGDMGCFDAQGILWFLGRKSHCLLTSRGLRPPVGVENVFLGHEGVARCALVGRGAEGAEQAVLIVEPKPGQAPTKPGAREAFVAELRARAQTSSVSEDVEQFLFHPSLPVDPRHNSKIHRGELKSWAASQTPLEARP